jgi:hypothetical protein
MQDFHNDMTVRRVISPVSGGANDTASVGQIIDHQGFEGAEYLIALGSIADADATFTVLLEEGDAANLSDAAAVADADLLGTEAVAGFIFSSDDQVRKLGYKGKKRYTRLTLTPATNTGAWLHSAVVVLCCSRKKPLTNQVGE